MKKIVELDEDDVRRIIARFYGVSADKVNIFVDENFPYEIIAAKILLEEEEL